MPMMEPRRVHPTKKQASEILEYSPQSVLHAMEKFSAAVASMHQSVLVPCRLQDINDPDLGDLHAAYKLLSKTKVDLLFGDIPILSKKPKNGGSRQGSQASLKQLSEINIANGSSPSLADLEKDAFVDPSLVNLDPSMLKLHSALNQNLKSLHAILEQMTISAEKVTNMYLKEVGGGN